MRTHNDQVGPENSIFKHPEFARGLPNCIKSDAPSGGHMTQEVTP